MPTLFSRIIAGELPSHKVAENDDFLAFLDIQPLVLGHTLVVPKQEVDSIFGLDEKTYEHFWMFARKVALGLGQAVPCKRVAVAVIGLEVPHAHIHLVPINSIQEMNFSNTRVATNAPQMDALAIHIASYL
jgi:histidine triad (HIT) family protein